MENVRDLTDKEYLDFSRVVKKTEEVLLDEFKKDRSVILKSGGLLPHFHFHIYPLSKDTSWQMIKEVFDKKVSAHLSASEKIRISDALNRKLNSELR